ncbi:unnamed protein product [Rotaria sp. Silwood2]|nr:unnamed protein product [Rotaria sp. Silwood2]CAF2655156.1 unnamed protein product [Rotaria sp. Silwood2]CAF2860810.1 unnamed protein product [Rotaria sp. Silwood2]CAF3027962.1 unnamed protein product [Rotaria sp. Silwood2]CAF3891641.1 unnamed protein product [Rotaria sp. Silwood2]
MPFIGRDWRAYGELWTKTDIGSWERPRRLSLSSSSINVNSSLSDVFNALEIANSVGNIRRFNYIAKVVQILFKEKLGELSGNAQRSLFQVIERMIDMVFKTRVNISLIQRIVTQFHNSIQSAYPFYYYIGSAQLWQRHIKMLTRMQETIKQVQTNMIKTDEDNSKLTFDYLPVVMQREVIRRLDSGTDIVNVGMINSNLYRVSQELLIWRQLCLYHFGGDTQNSNNSKLGEKILGLMRKQQDDIDTNNIDWKTAYFKLKRQYGLREVYAEMIHQCQLCKCLFWQDSDHSCPYDTLSPTSIPITPRKLVTMLV